MSIRLVAEEIKRFLDNPDPEVICIKGKWGVGKTFAWKEYLKEAAEKDAIALKRYSYVSLFGVDSIESVRTTLFESAVNVDQIENGPSIKTVRASMQSLELAGRFLSKIGRYIPKIKDYIPELFLAVRNQIICIDDLERRGKNLSTNEVLGFVSFLKNERKCKVILLLNDEPLIEGGDEDFKTQLEKVIDTEMRFEPSALEAADIGIDKATSFSEKFSETCIGLDIVNIRVIRKIETLLSRLEVLLASHDKRIFDASIASMTLLGWSVYQPTLAPSLDFIKDFLRYADLLDDKKTVNEKERQWRLLINNINFSNFDEFDALLLKAIEDGYFDSNSIESAAKELDKKYKLEDKDNSFHDAWRKYHESFECNDDEVLNNFYASFKKNVQSISPMNADATIVLLRKFGRGAQADELIKFYMDERNEDEKFYDPNRSMFLSLNDPVFKKAFADKLETFKDIRNPEEVLIHIARTSSWNPEDIQMLSKISSNDFYNLFKKIRRDDLRIIVSQSLKFANYNPTDDNMKLISANAEEALRRIAKESPMNRERVLTYGVKIEEEPIQE